MTAANRALWTAAVLWIVLLALLAMAAVQALVGLHRRATDSIATIEPRFARLLGVAEGRDRIAAAASEARRGMLRHAYEATRDASQTANDAQQRARDLFSKAGLDVITMQVQPVRQTPHFERVPISLRIDGELQALQAALATLPDASPSLFVEGMVLQSASSGEAGAARVVCELQLFALRAKP